MSGYLIRTKDGHRGPFSPEQLRTLVAGGKIPSALRVIVADSGASIEVEKILASADRVAAIEEVAPQSIAPPVARPDAPRPRRIAAAPPPRSSSAVSRRTAGRRAKPAKKKRGGWGAGKTVLCVIGVLILAGAGWYWRNWKILSEPVRYSMSFPPGWKRSRVDVPKLGMVEIATVSDANEAAEPGAFLVLLTLKTVGDPSVDQLLDKLLPSISKGAAYTVKSRGSVQLKGGEASRIELRLEAGGEIYSALVYGFIKEHSIAILLARGKPETLAEHSVLIHECARSFEFQ